MARLILQRLSGQVPIAYDLIFLPGLSMATQVGPDLVPAEDSHVAYHFAFRHQKLFKCKLFLEDRGIIIHSFLGFNEFIGLEENVPASLDNGSQGDMF